MCTTNTLRKLWTCLKNVQISKIFFIIIVLFLIIKFLFLTIKFFVSEKRVASYILRILYYLFIIWVSIYNSCDLKIYRLLNSLHIHGYRFHIRVLFLIFLLQSRLLRGR